MTKQFLLIVFMSLVSFSLIAQNKIADTNLDELVIVSKKKKKIKKHKITGSPFFHFYNKDELTVTGVNSFPKGKINAVNFTFNTKYSRVVGAMFDEINTDYIDTEFGLMLFEMKKNGTIGNLISDSKTKFLISKEHQGDFRVDLSEFDLPNEGFFIGIKVLSETLKNKASFYVSMCGNDKYTSYDLITFSNQNSKNNNLELTESHLKMTFEIEQ